MLLAQVDLGVVEFNSTEVNLEPCMGCWLLEIPKILHLLESFYIAFLILLLF